VTFRVAVGIGVKVLVGNGVEVGTGYWLGLARVAVA
jgi:hypothetical protein